MCAYKNMQMALTRILTPIASLNMLVFASVCQNCQSVGVKVEMGERIIACCSLVQRKVHISVS